MSSQQTENYNDCSARQHGVCLTNNIPGKNANESTYEGCAGIKVLDKNITMCYNEYTSNGVYFFVRF